MTGAEKLLDYAWAGLLALVGLVWKLFASKLGDMQKDFDKKLDALANETGRNRDVSARIFEKLDDMSRESADRHERLLIALHQGLDRKVDK